MQHNFTTQAEFLTCDAIVDGISSLGVIYLREVDGQRVYSLSKVRFQESVGTDCEPQIGMGCALTLTGNYITQISAN